MINFRIEIVWLRKTVVYNVIFGHRFIYQHTNGLSLTDNYSKFCTSRVNWFLALIVNDLAHLEFDTKTIPINSISVNPVNRNCHQSKWRFVSHFHIFLLLSLKGLISLHEIIKNEQIQTSIINVKMGWAIQRMLQVPILIKSSSSL